MAIRNQIRVASIKAYDTAKGYATIVLKQGGEWFSDNDRTIEEVMTLQLNTASQKLPDVGADCLIAFDDTGDPYVLGVIGSESQPIPEPLEPGTLVVANVTDDDPLSQLKMYLTAAGKLAGEKTSMAYGPIELITILIDVLNLIATSTCPTGAPLSNAASITLEALKLTEYQKV